MSITEAVILLGLLGIAAMVAYTLVRVIRLQMPAIDAKLEALDQRLTDNLTFVRLAVSGLRDDNLTSSQALRLELSTKLDQIRASNELLAKSLREELLASFEKLSANVSLRMGEQATEQTRRFDSFSKQLVDHRSAAAEDAKKLRDEVNGSLSQLGQKVAESLDSLGKKQVEALTATTNGVKELAAENVRQQDALKQTVEGRLDNLRAENSEKLELMRATVDEKLQGTLEKRLGASFSQVNENLERVFKSVGEMQALATGVGDLKRVLTNIKVRGTWGEGSLGNLLEQVLTPEQYSTNVEVHPNSGHRVEYAIRLPGQGDSPLWLPIDCKMPLLDYERLIAATEAGDSAAVDEAAKSLNRAILLAARDICTKYVHPPYSTDFAVMFLPSEGLFAEVVRRPGLVDQLQREYRVSVTGPTTLMAYLNSLRMGFRSLAIQQRSSEVWQVLGAVKTEFGKFGPVLEKVHKKLGEAQNVVEDARKRGRAMGRALRDVETLPEPAAADVLAITINEALEEGEPTEVLTP